MLFIVSIAMEHIRELMASKDAIEKELDALLTDLKTVSTVNGSNSS
jgi:hypothetical protein